MTEDSLLYEVLTTSYLHSPHALSATPNGGEELLWLSAQRERIPLPMIIRDRARELLAYLIDRNSLFSVACGRPINPL